MKMKKLIGIVLVVAGIGSGLGSVLLVNYYAETRPRMLEPSAGRTISLNNHGAIVFLDRSEDALLTDLGYLLRLAVHAAAFYWWRVAANVKKEG
jgi:hypothetical protein